VMTGKRDLTLRTLWLFEFIEATYRCRRCD
jgi:hypothetical protein